MHAHRPLAAVALALTTLIAATLALSGCTATPAAALGTVVPGAGDPIVAVVGDSIESGFGLQPEEAWPVLVAVDRRWRLENLSEAGAGFTATGDDGTDFGAQVDRAIALRADVVLIGASDNDLGADSAAVAAAMRAQVARLREALPHALLVGFTALSGEAGDDQLAPLDGALRSAVTAADGRWLDLGQPYRGVEGLVQDDGEHPTPAGQRAIASAVLSRLDALA